LIGNLAGNIASGLAGVAVGGTAGAATASNVNLYNAANDKNDTEAKKEAQELKQALDKERAALGQAGAKVPPGAQAATVPSAALAAGAAAGKVAPRNDVNLASPERTTHILTGDTTGGGHQWPGGPGKSVFPQDWSSSKIMNVVSDIATDPSVPETVQASGRIVKNGSVDGIAIRVVIEPASKGGGIVTAFPTNVPRNPK
ncbi:EndoU domain-containing protein, partial [Paraburkholderia tropica]|uniref:EndoU domain-containing protein n=1 Tax=Paraburkholderia tropica TaxID=92647 RepID=UPI002ABD14AC